MLFRSGEVVSDPVRYASDAIARAAVRVLVRPELLRAPRGPAWLDLATPNPVLRPGAVRAEAARP